MVVAGPLPMSGDNPLSTTMTMNEIEMLALVVSTDTRHNLSHSDTHMAKMVRKPMKVAMSAAPG